MNLAENLRIYRRRFDLSQEELAEKCQVSRQAIAKWENGESIPTIEKLVYLADLYRVSLDELVGRKEYAEVFEEYVKRCIPSEIKFGDNDDTLPVIVRFFAFMEKHGLSAEDRLCGLKEVFLVPKEPVQK